MRYLSGKLSLFSIDRAVVAGALTEFSGYHTFANVLNAIGFGIDSIHLFEITRTSKRQLEM